MNKEQILSELKSLILPVRDRSERFNTDEAFLKNWQSRQQAVGIEVKQLSEEDKKWVEGQYKIWFEVEIKPHIPDDPALQSKLL